MTAVQVTNYTTTDAIRSALGIDSSDVSDEMIIDSNLQMELETDLDEWLPEHATIYSEGNGSSPSIEQRLKRNYLVLYAQFYCAYQLSLRPLTFTQIETDGKNQMNRFSKLETEEIAMRAKANMDKYRAKLDGLHNGTQTASIPILKVGIPDYDPVTNS